MDNIKFEELNISNEIKKAIGDMGFEEATPIQTSAIPHVLEGRDIVGQAQTGTGKTAAFGIPILEKLNTRENKLQILVLCPTRELAIQVSEEINKLAKYIRGVKTIPIYGGQSIERQIRALKKGVQVVIGTPGRVMDHMRRGTIKLNDLKMMVLDEADEMLNMGFREDIETILKDTPEGRQTVLFSATMPRAILDIAKNYQKNPEIIKVTRRKLTTPSIDQYYFEAKQRDKFEILTRLIDIENPKLALIFCNTKKKVDELVGLLQGRGYFADGLHGDLKQSQRDQVMGKFRHGDIDLLVATDVAARGIDVDDVDLVFNYDVPQDEEYYVHRIGRTGRAGRFGKAFTFVVGREIYKLKDIQRYTNTKIILRPTPTIGDVQEIKIKTLVEKINHILENENLGKERQIIDNLLEGDHTSLDIAGALLRMIMGNQERESTQRDLQERETSQDSEMVRFFINIGKTKNVRARDILGAIAGETGIPGNLIGSIDIYDKYTFVDIPKEYAKEVAQGMKKGNIRGNSVNVERARSRKSR